MMFKAKLVIEAADKIIFVVKMTTKTQKLLRNFLKVHLEFVKTIFVFKMMKIRRFLNECSECECFITFSHVAKI